jgi:hypothetical protein
MSESVESEDGETGRLAATGEVAVCAELMSGSALIRASPIRVRRDAAEMPSGD